MGCLYCDKSIDGKTLTYVGDHKSCDLEILNRIAQGKCTYCGENPDPGIDIRCGCGGVKYKNYPGT